MTPRIPDCPALDHDTYTALRRQLLDDLRAASWLEATLCRCEGPDCPNGSPDTVHVWSVFDRIAQGLSERRAAGTWSEAEETAAKQAGGLGSALQRFLREGRWVEESEESEDPAETKRETAMAGAPPGFFAQATAAALADCGRNLFGSVAGQSDERFPAQQPLGPILQTNRDFLLMWCCVRLEDRPVAARRALVRRVIARTTSQWHREMENLASVGQDRFFSQTAAGRRAYEELLEPAGFALTHVMAGLGLGGRDEQAFLVGGSLVAQCLLTHGLTHPGLTYGVYGPWEDTFPIREILESVETVAAPIVPARTGARPPGHRRKR